MPCKRKIGDLDAPSPSLPKEQSSTASPSDFFAVALFCGTGGLTYAMRRFFKDSIGVDVSNKPGKTRILSMDLRKPEHQAMVSEWCCSSQCLWVHFGTPCGTASRARMRRMSKRSHGPPPLRSDRFPLGLPNLSGVNLARVRSANILYRFSCELMIKLDSLGKIFTMENPWTSLFWVTPYWLKVANSCKTYMVELHYCMFGGKRKKHTALATNCEAVMELNVLCDEQHPHAPWTFSNGKFATSEEAEYPVEFCKQLACCVFHHLSKQFSFPDPSEKIAQLKAAAFPQMATGAQPSCPVPPLVSEFACVCSIHFCPAFTHVCDSKGNLLKCLNFSVGGALLCIPHGSRVLRVAKSSRGGGVPFCNSFNLSDIQIRPGRSLSNLQQPLREFQLVCNNGRVTFPGFESVCLTCKRNGKCTNVVQPSLEGDQVIFGIRWSEASFVQQAVSAGHPFNIFNGLADEVKEAIGKISSSHPAQIVLERKRKLAYWVNVAKDLEKLDTMNKMKASPERQNILKPKRIELLRRMITECGYADVGLPDDILRGFSLVGKVPQSKVLPKKFSPAVLPLSDLRGGARKAQQALRCSVTSSGDEATDTGLWEKTMTEVDRGWLIGPLPWESLHDTDVVSRRFSVNQNGKLRPIDDYSQSQVNATIHSFETASVDGVDFVCALFCFFIQSLQTEGRSSELVTRSLDLSSAYRQLTISEDSAQYAFVAVFNPNSASASVFRQVSLPFGSKAAVNAFIRCSRCIQWLAAKVFHIPLSCYFDDYVIASTPELAHNTQQTFGLLLDLLGWQYDKDGPKADVFSHHVTALGVTFSLASSKNRIVTVGNTEKRILEVCPMIDSILERKTLSLKEAQVARGRLAFCDAFVFGKAGKSALQEITAHAYARPAQKFISSRLTQALFKLKSRLQESPPRTMSCSLSETVYIFLMHHLTIIGMVVLVLSYLTSVALFLLGCRTCSVGKMFCPLHLKER